VNVRLPEDAIRRFDEEGYLLLPALFGAEEIAALQRPLPEILARHGPEVVREEGNGRAAKMVFGLHFTDDAYRRATLHPRMLGPAEQLTRERVHVFQSRVNPKLPGGGAGWGWHQDFNQWRRFDGVEEPRAVLSAIFLDDVDDANAPLNVIPGSHVQHFDVPDAMEIPAHMLDGLTAGARPLTGPAGTVVFFHALLVHGSAPNTSPRARPLFYVVYNPVTNTRIAGRRARHHCSTDFTAVEPLADDCLLPIRTRPFAGPCHIAGRERELVLEVLESGEWSGFRAVSDVDNPRFLGGRRVRELEARFAERAETRFAVACNSATSALIMALGAVGIRPGDEVLVPPMTFTATATAPLVWGARPVFVDVDERTHCMDPIDAARKITPRTRAMIPVHLAGNSADMDALRALARTHSLRVIEDAAQALGVRYRGRAVGSIGDAGVFSLTEMKTITCGEGGILVTDDPSIAQKARLIRNHGETVDDIIGFNFRLTEIQAAVALAQLDALDERLARRHQNALYLMDRLRRVAGLLPPLVTEGADPKWYILKWLWRGQPSRDVIARRLADEGIPITPGYPRLLHQLPLHTNRFGAASCPVAERINGEMLWFGAINAPNTLTDMDDVVRAFEKVTQTCLS
jgi:dTDP-4-amino-4,6-dideoxygalactose transaminase/ectoine hydroxylase-related dioxygenase (phytanoyl-CoA dioxygenase family)